MPTWLETEKVKEYNPYQKIKRLETENKNLTDQIAAQELNYTALVTENQRLNDENTTLNNNILNLKNENEQLKQSINSYIVILNKIKGLDDDLLNYIKNLLRAAQDEEKAFYNRYLMVGYFPEPAKSKYLGLVNKRAVIEKIYNEAKNKYEKKYSNLP